MLCLVSWICESAEEDLEEASLEEHRYEVAIVADAVEHFYCRMICVRSVLVEVGKKQCVRFDDLRLCKPVHTEILTRYKVQSLSVDKQDN